MQTQVIQATVNPRLLSKASRLFTGTIDGRIIEILQNARRAGATQVQIYNRGNLIVVEDNGRGIDDFAKLLDLGGSGWEQSLESSEDPAGVGLFCLAPREVIIRSNGKILRIQEGDWTGAPVQLIDDDDDPPNGTILCFPDAPWTPALVDPHAVFSGLHVKVDDHECPNLPFVSQDAVAHAELGCRIEVCNHQALGEWHRRASQASYGFPNVLVNFHGQVVSFDYHPVSEQNLRFLINLTVEPTGIRLMLPARTRLVENEAFTALKNALELEAYRFIERRGEHELPYKEYLRAKELGIQLPEAKPTYSIGLLASSEAPEPVTVEAPQNFPLESCYRFDADQEGNEMDATNIHLLAALGKFATPFVPVEISNRYNGYSWAKLPTVNEVSVTVGKVIHEDWLWSEKIACVDSIAIEARTSDGRTWKSEVCMAVLPSTDKNEWAMSLVYVTQKARELLAPSHIWHHAGGWSEDGDTYETQENQFTEALDRFWAEVVGPDEHLRQRILTPLLDIDPEWDEVKIARDGTVTVHFTDGSQKALEVPAETGGAQ